MLRIVAESPGEAGDSFLVFRQFLIGVPQVVPRGDVFLFQAESFLVARNRIVQAADIGEGVPPVVPGGRELSRIASAVS